MGKTELSTEAIEKQKRDEERILREQEEEEKEKRAQEERVKRQKEKEAKQKEREKKLKRKELRERKRIQEIIKYPFKVLLEISVLLSILYFTIQLFGQSKQIIDALFASFVLFVILMFGGGLIMTAVIYVISENRIKEIQEEKRLLEQKRIEEETKLQQEALDAMDSEKNDMFTLAADVEARRKEELRKLKELQESGVKTESNGTIDIVDDVMDNDITSLPNDFLYDTGSDLTNDDSNSNFEEFPEFIQR